VRLILKMDAFLWFAASTVWLTSVIQTLLDHGDNPRFSVPTQSLLMFLVLWWGLQITRRFVKRKGNGMQVSDVERDGIPLTLDLAG